MSLSRSSVPCSASAAAAPSLAALFDAPLRPAIGGSPALYLPALSALGPRVFVLFVCGNPGVADYYETYLRTLQCSPLLQGRLSSLCVSHRGHAASQRSTRLADQIAQQVQLLDSIRASHPSEEVKVVLIGHSVGAWIALEALKQRPEAVNAVHLLFPTVAWIGKTPNAGKLRPLFTSVSYPLIYPLLSILQLLPLFLLHLLLRTLLRQPEEGARATARLLRAPGAVRNALSMGREEMSTIRKVREETKSAVAALGQRGFVRAYWARGEEDQWTPSWIRTQVESELSLESLAPLQPSCLQAKPEARRMSSFLSPRRRAEAKTGASGSNGGSTSGGAGHSKTASTPTPSRIPVAAASPRRLARRLAAAAAPPALVVHTSSTPNGASLAESTELELEEEAEDDGSLTEVAASSSSSSDDERGDGVARRLLFKTAAPAAEEGARWPSLTSTVCAVDTPHAFCLAHGVEMADVAATWLARDFEMELQE